MEIAAICHGNNRKRDINPPWTRRRAGARVSRERGENRRDATRVPGAFPLHARICTLDIYSGGNSGNYKERSVRTRILFSWSRCIDARACALRRWTWFNPELSLVRANARARVRSERSEGGGNPVVRFYEFPKNPINIIVTAERASQIIRGSRRRRYRVNERQEAVRIPVSSSSSSLLLSLSHPVLSQALTTNASSFYPPCYVSTCSSVRLPA